MKKSPLPKTIRTVNTFYALPAPYQDHLHSERSDRSGDPREKVLKASVFHPAGDQATSLVYLSMNVYSCMQGRSGR